MMLKTPERWGDLSEAKSCRGNRAQGKATELAQADRPRRASRQVSSKGRGEEKACCAVGRSG